ncbi:MAG: nucleotide exchange factor GrpE [Treponema sp.]|nr:nucleotide exchange factor GrpE [Treponema sp.]
MKKEKKMNEQEKNENSSMEQSVESHDSDQTTEVAQEEQTAEEKIAELEKQIADLNDKYIRTVAENDNWRKRMIQQKDEAVAYANASLLGDLLESLDNFDRTVEAAEIATDAKSIADGVKMINKSLVSMLETKYNLVGYGVKGDAFDPDIHEAIGKAEGDVKVPELQEVYLKGYKLKERVIRHAKVMVLMPKE